MQYAASLDLAQPAHPSSLVRNVNLIGELDWRYHETLRDFIVESVAIRRLVLSYAGR